MERGEDHGERLRLCGQSGKDAIKRGQVHEQPRNHTSAGDGGTDDGLRHPTIQTVTLEADGFRCEVYKPGDNVENSSFASLVGPDQASYATLLNGRTPVIQCFRSTEADPTPAA